MSTEVPAAQDQIFHQTTETEVNCWKMHYFLHLLKAYFLGSSGPRVENEESNLSITSFAEEELPGDETEVQLSGVLHLLAQTYETQETQAMMQILLPSCIS